MTSEDTTQSIIHAVGRRYLVAAAGTIILSMSTLADLTAGGRAVCVPIPALHRFSPQEYRQLPSSGLLREDARVELLDGWIIDMPPIGPSHSFGVENSRTVLARLSPAGWHIRTQQPVSLKASEPQPDLAMVRGSLRTYAARHPRASEIGLLIEVSDPSLDIDRDLKLPIYAAADIVECWIVNVVDRQVEVHQRPRPATARRPARYARRRVVGEGGSIALALDGKTLGQVPVAAFFA
jgi:Uma2 family endonuclease